MRGVALDNHCNIEGCGLWVLSLRLGPLGACFWSETMATYTLF